MGEEKPGKPLIRIISAEPPFVTKDDITLNFVQVDGKLMRVKPDIQIKVINVLRIEAEKRKRLGKELKTVLLKPGDETEYDEGIVRHLRLAIKSAKDQPKPRSSRRLFRQLSLEYHPDLYLTEADDVKALATEYTKVLLALKENGEFNW